MRCKTCHYALKGLTGPPHRCPECGNPFDPEDPTTFETHPKFVTKWMILATVLSIPALYLTFRTLSYDPDPLDPYDGARFAAASNGCFWTVICVPVVWLITNVVRGLQLRR